MDATPESKSPLQEINNANAVPVVYSVNSPSGYSKNIECGCSTYTPPAYSATVRNDAYLANPAAKRALIIFGILQTVFGLVGLGFGIAKVYFIYSLGFIPAAEGVWCSIWVVIAGIIGCVGGCRQRLTCRIANTYLAFSIVSIVFMVLLIVLIILHSGSLPLLISAVLSLVLGICGASCIGHARNKKQC